MSAEIPDFRVKDVRGRKKRPFLPERDRNGRYSLSSWMSCELGKLVFMGMFVAGAFSYGKVVQKPEYDNFKKKTKAAEERPKEPANPVKATAADYGIDAAQLPTDLKKKDSFKMSWAYSDGKSPEQRKKEAEEAEAKQRAEQEAQAKAEAEALAKEEEARKAQEAAMAARMPKAPAAAPQAAAQPQQVARAPIPVPVKKLSTGGGLSGGIMKGFSSRKTQGVPSGGAGGAPQMPAAMPAMPSGMPQMPAGMPQMPPGMPNMPGMDPQALANNPAALAAMQQQMAAGGAGGVGAQALAGGQARASSAANRATSGSGGRGLGRAMMAAKSGAAGSIESGRGSSGQAFDDNAERKGEVSGPTAEASESSTEQAAVVALPGGAAAVSQGAPEAARPADQPAAASQEGQALAQSESSAGPAQPLRDPSAGVLAAANMGSIFLGGLLAVQGLLQRKES